MIQSNLKLGGHLTDMHFAEYIIVFFSFGNAKPPFRIIFTAMIELWSYHCLLTYHYYR